MNSRTCHETSALKHSQRHCSTCSLRELCLPVGLSSDELDSVADLVSRGRKLHRGEVLFRAHSPFENLYAVRLGSFKSSVLGVGGQEQITGFAMMGDLMGMDGIERNVYASDMVALEDSEVCTFPFSAMEALGLRIPALRRHLYRVLSREIRNDHGVMLLLGKMQADERVASFIRNLSLRHAQRGYSGSAFHLRMTREEIGSYLGLSLETVSRMFARLQQQGVLDVQGRLVSILDMDALAQIGAPCK
ncbi:fumarate/nitrate reduction transcriptional regulator Fnr [Amantichitinum ursilacus]|uniref:Transcriptional activator protein Anr n=1 Tax=Amantichitinum ursilacus TaxID=857265 RepID=A0A0N0GL98_9NEIS|nr:fumarate/nitrate reduction transcriptional regulator Fnr [Amantichitinum ursilacus]KPC49635.1 Transcriptional activator protein Anr [Amantichitinum ursilacus]